MGGSIVKIIGWLIVGAVFVKVITDQQTATVASSLLGGFQGLLGTVTGGVSGSGSPGVGATQQTAPPSTTHGP